MAVARADLVVSTSTFNSLHSVTGNLGDTGNDQLRFGNGKTTPRTAHACGIRHENFLAGPFHYVTRSPGYDAPRAL